MITYDLMYYLRDRKTQFRNVERFRFEVSDDSEALKYILRHQDDFRGKYAAKDIVGAGFKIAEHPSWEPVLGTDSLEEAVKKHGKFE